MERTRHSRCGFTLVEVAIAIVVLSVGILALASAAAATVRSMADAARIDEAARTAEAERERAYAATCAASSGTDAVRGALIAWAAAPAGSMLALHQSIALPPSAPSAVEISAAGACR